MANEKKMVNGVVFEMTDEEQATLNASHAEEQVRLDARAWLDGRLSEYPPLQEQLDMQYWDSVNGTTTWQDLITLVKSTYPKRGS
jgi:hypothetical protein